MDIPRHVGIIMDGNGRWAKGRGLPRLAGHVKGIDTLEKIVDQADSLGIKYLSVYAFSTENWKRPAPEVGGLMKLFKVYIARKLAKIKERNGRLRFAGRRDRFSDGLIDVINGAEAETANAPGMQLIICLDYGGRYEIVDAVKKIIADGKNADEITEELISENIYLPDVPDIDLIIRTSGELRTSNFNLWRGAYSEYYCTQTLWPDFDEKELDAAVEFYAGRDRRKGGVSK